MSGHCRFADIVALIDYSKEATIFVLSVLDTVPVDPVCSDPMLDLSVSH